MNDDYYPDSWVVVKVKDTGVYKVLAGWSGGYLDGDSWRMNSGITSVADAGDYWRFYGASGSCYVLHKKGHAMRMSIAGTYNQIKDHVELLDKDTAWESLDYDI